MERMGHGADGTWSGWDMERMGHGADGTGGWDRWMGPVDGTGGWDRWMGLPHFWPVIEPAGVIHNQRRFPRLLLQFSTACHGGFEGGKLTVRP